MWRQDDLFRTLVGTGVDPARTDERPGRLDVIRDAGARRPASSACRPAR